MTDETGRLGEQPEESRGPGRPPIYDPDHHPAMAAVLGDIFGATNGELARFFGVSERTVERWGAEHEEFRRARAQARAEADKHVEARLYRRAMGYSHPAVKILQHEGQPVVVPYTEHYPPDTQAITWWLKNRQPGKWKDKSEVEHSGAIDFAGALDAARKRAKGAA